MRQNRSIWLLPIALVVIAGGTVAKASAAAATDTHAAASTSSQELGALFFTPRQRLELEKERKGKPAPGPNGEAEVERPVINGVATRSDGRLTVWIDGKPRWESASANHVSTLSSADVGASAALLKSDEGTTEKQPPSSIRKPVTRRSAKLRVK